MFTKLADTTKAAIFSVLVLCLAVGAALSINMFDLASNFVVWASVWSCTPLVAALIMLLMVTRDGYSREGWKSLGLHRLGLNVWWIAFGVTLLITVAAAAIVWATPLASFVMPEGGILNVLINFVLAFLILVLTFSLAEEIGMRGYLLPKLLPLGRRRALFVSGLVFATWHMPLIFLTPLLPVGNKLISLPLFYGSVVAASFLYGYLRLYSGSLWPSAIAHATHNAAWGGVLGAFTATSYSVVVNKYLVGDYGLLIFVGAVIVAIWVGYYLRSGMNQAQEEAGAGIPEAPPTPSAAAVPK